jgi:hypothetical protein
MSKHIRSLAGLGLSVLLSACGGNSGGGGAGASSPSSSLAGGNAIAEGAWHSQLPNGDVLDVLALENGSLYALSVAATLGAPLLAFDQGSYTVSGDKLTAQLTHFNELGSTTTGSVGATVVNGASITGTATTLGRPTPNAFALQPLSASDVSYNYNNPAALATVAGPWVAGTLLEKSTPTSFTIDAAGVLSGSNLGCSFTGTVTPRLSGKSVFDVGLTYGQSPCTTPGVTFTGVALSYIASNGKRQFTAALQDSNRAFGTMLYAQR